MENFALCDILGISVVSVSDGGRVNLARGGFARGHRLDWRLDLLHLLNADLVSEASALDERVFTLVYLVA